MDKIDKTPWLVIIATLFLLGMSLTADGAGRLNWQQPIAIAQRLWKGAQIIGNIDLSKANVANREPAPKTTPEQEGERGSDRTINGVYEGMKDE